MMTVFAFVCIVVNLAGIAMCFMPGYPNSGRKIFNVAVHSVGTWCGFLLLS